MVLVLKWNFILLNIINYFLTKPLNNEAIKSTKNMKKITLAIPAAAPAIPPNPNIAAINAITTNVIVQRNIIL